MIIFTVDADQEIAFGLEKLLGRNISKLTGGEKYKITFASVYALSTEVYVLDEASFNWDIHGIVELRELLTLLKGQGKTIMITEHQLYYLKDIVHGMSYMEKGSVEAKYTGSDFLQMSSAERAAKGLRAMDLTGIWFPAVQGRQENSVLAIRGLTVIHGKRGNERNTHITASRSDWSFPIW